MPGTHTPINWLTLGRHLHLSPQQRHILQLIVEQDLTAQRIAITLSVTTGAINTQLDRMRKKLGVHTRAAIVAKAWMAWMEMEGGKQ